MAGDRKEHRCLARIRLLYPGSRAGRFQGPQLKRRTPSVARRAHIVLRAQETCATTLAMWWAVLSIALVQGVRHAFEPDHVSAIVSLSSRRLSEALRFAFWWSVGHALSLFVLGGSLLWARTLVPHSLETCFEVAGALLLVALGLRAVRMNFTKADTKPSAQTSSPASSAGLSPSGQPLAALLPFAVGAVHGLGGSSPLAALAMGHASSQRGFLFLATYALGVMLAMSLAGLAASTLASRLIRQANVQRGLGTIAGSGSIVVGLAWLAQAI
jgi:cytochrome c biogenesis protein CcdA